MSMHIWVCMHMSVCMWARGQFRSLFSGLGNFCWDRSLSDPDVTKVGRLTVPVSQNAPLTLTWLTLLGLQVFATTLGFLSVGSGDCVGVGFRLSCLQDKHFPDRALTCGGLFKHRHSLIAVILCNLVSEMNGENIGFAHSDAGQLPSPSLKFATVPHTQPFQ